MTGIRKGAAGLEANWFRFLKKHVTCTQMGQDLGTQSLDH